MVLVKNSDSCPVVGKAGSFRCAEIGYCRPGGKRYKRNPWTLHQHDNLDETNGENDEVEVTILTGDEKVGVRSDRAIATTGRGSNRVPT